MTVEAAKEAGLVGVKRVLDSTPLYDAVATMDTITLMRSAMRGVLKAADGELEGELRAVIKSGDDYASSAKPQVDWDDEEARKELVDSRAKDAYACLGLLEGRELPSQVKEAAELLASVLGQDLEQAEDGTFRIARRVAKDRIISTVDPEARHGRKTQAHAFDGWKGHIAADPDSEIITSTTVTAGNQGDAGAAPSLLEDIATDVPGDDGAEQASPVASGQAGGGRRGHRGDKKANKQAAHAARRAAHAARRQAQLRSRKVAGPPPRAKEATPAVYGDAAYGAGELLAYLDENGIDPRVKVQPPVAPRGLFPKDRFKIDLAAGTVTCPAGNTVAIAFGKAGDGTAFFSDACSNCPLRQSCTTAGAGRTISISPHEELLQAQRRRCADPSFAADYRATRPKVERILAHLMLRRHGGRRARARGRRKVDADFNLLAASRNLARLATLGLRSTSSGWVAAGT